MCQQRATAPLGAPDESWRGVAGWERRVGLPNCSASNAPGSAGMRGGGQCASSAGGPCEWLPGAAGQGCALLQAGRGGAPAGAALGGCMHLMHVCSRLHWAAVAAPGAWWAVCPGLMAEAARLQRPSAADGQERAAGRCGAQPADGAACGACSVSRVTHRAHVTGYLVLSTRHVGAGSDWCRGRRCRRRGRAAALPGTQPLMKRRQGRCHLHNPQRVPLAYLRLK